MYLDGSLVASASSVSLHDTTSPTSSNVIGLGCSDNKSSSQIFGHISNVRIWDFALSEQEASFA